MAFYFSSPSHPFNYFFFFISHFSFHFLASSLHHHSLSSLHGAFCLSAGWGNTEYVSCRRHCFCLLLHPSSLPPFLHPRRCWALLSADGLGQRGQGQVPKFAGCGLFPFAIHFSPPSPPPFSHSSLSTRRH